MLQPLLCPDESGPEQQLANRLRSGFRTLMAARGADLSYGRTLSRLLREAGLDDVQADAYFRSPRRHVPCWRPQRCGRSAIVRWRKDSPPTRRSTVTWRTSPPDGSIWPPPR